jgi:hypothetical protein
LETEKFFCEDPAAPSRHLSTLHSAFYQEGDGLVFPLSFAVPEVRFPDCGNASSVPFTGTVGIAQAPHRGGATLLFDALRLQVARLPS